MRPENLLWGKPEIPDRGYFTFARNHSSSAGRRIVAGSGFSSQPSAWLSK